MKLSNLFMIALLAGTLGVLGCGDDTTNPAGSGGSGTAGTGGSGTAGTGGSGTGGSGTGGSGGIDGATACGGAKCQANDVLRGTCEVGFDRCIALNPTDAEYLITAEGICGAI